MFRAFYHPRAFLIRRKNVARGLAARTKIISSLEREDLTAKALSQMISASYSSLLYHLHLMEDEHLVTRQDGKPFIWKLTGIGQKRLVEI